MHSPFFSENLHIDFSVLRLWSWDLCTPSHQSLLLCAYSPPVKRIQIKQKTTCLLTKLVLNMWTKSPIAMPHLNISQNFMSCPQSVKHFVLYQHRYCLISNQQNAYPCPITYTVYKKKILLTTCGYFAILETSFALVM